MKINFDKKISNFINKILTKLNIPEQTRLEFIKYFFNTSWMFAEKILMLIVSFFVGIYIARFLEPEKYGLLNFAFSFVFIFQAFSKLGLDGIITRNLIQNLQNKNDIIGTSFVLKSIGSVLSILLIFVVLYFFKSDYKTDILIIIIASSMIFSGFETFQFYFDSIVQAKYNSFSNILAGIFVSILKIVLLFYKADLVFFAIVYSIEIFLKQILPFVFYQYQNKRIRLLKFNKYLVKIFLKDSWPLIITGFAVILYLRIDQIMIKEMLGNTKAGIYSAAVSISEIWYFIPVVITNSLFPAIIGAKNVSYELYQKRLQQLYNFMSLIAVAITVPLFIWGKEIINIVFGNSFSDAGVVLQIHILSLIFVFWGTASGKWLLAENFVKISLYRTLAGAIVNITANIFLIEYYGISGAAVATLLAYSTAGFLFDIFYKKTRISFIMKCKSFNLTYYYKQKK